MRKILVAAALLLATGVHAMDLDVHAGYSTLSMGQWNRANAALFGYYPTDTLTPLTSALVAGLDLTTGRFSPWDGLHLGLRTDYLQSNEGEQKSVTSSSGWGGTNHIAYMDQANLVDALLGGQWRAPFLTSGLEAGLGAWVGAAYGTLAVGPVTDATSSVPAGNYSGIFLTGQVEATLRYQVSSRISLAANAGWRWADAGTLKDSNGTPLYDPLSLWQNGDHSPVDIDFSGATAQGSLNFSF